MKSFVVASFLLAVLLHVAESAEYNRHVTLKPGVFDVSWYYNATNTRFYFRIQAKTTGWAALGLTSGDGKNMMNLDIALGGVKSGIPYLNDYATEARGEKKPELDGNQDLSLTSGTESGGKTVLEFNRLADTTDSIQDLKLEEGKNVTLCFAIAVSDTTDSTNFIKHTSSDIGCSPVKYDMYADDSQPPTTSMTTMMSTPTTKPSPTLAGHLVPSLMIIGLAQAAISIIY